MSFSMIGTGKSTPAHVLDNEALTHMVDTSDEWISSRTGIRTRYICTSETLDNLAAEAAQNALSMANIQAEQIDLILCATLQGDYITPSLACMVQKKLGASCPAMDINAACTGFLYALYVAAGYFARKKAKYILVVAAECMSKYIDWTDRNTCVLFGDGAGAVVLQQGEDLLSCDLFAKGDEAPLFIKGNPNAFPLTERTAQPHCLHMNGQDIYRFATKTICHHVAAALQEASLSIEDIQYVLAHQANQRILDTAAAKLKIPSEKMVSVIHKYGNTSCASIPIMLDDMCREGKLTAGDLLLCTAFGAGLTSAAMIIRWHIS